MTRRRGGGGGGWGGPFGGPEPDLTRAAGERAGQTFRRIAGFFAPYRARLAFIAVLILITVSIGVVNPILLKLIIDNLPRRAAGPGAALHPGGLMIVLPIVTSAIGVWQATSRTSSASGS